MTTTTKQKTIPAERLKHELSYSAERDGSNWMLCGKCHECEWVGYMATDSILTTLPKDKLLLEHHLH